MPAKTSSSTHVTLHAHTGCELQINRALISQWQLHSPRCLLYKYMIHRNLVNDLTLRGVWPGEKDYIDSLVRGLLRALGEGVVRARRASTCLRALRDVI